MRGVLIPVGAALTLGWGGLAQAACIDTTLANAARLHEFETMMMDVSLRCTRIGMPMRSDHEDMVGTHRVAFEGAAQTLKVFFDRSVDPRHGSLYERYTTLIANHYGMGDTSPQSCRLFDEVVVQITRSTDGGTMLNTVTTAMIPHPMLERETCLAER